MNVYVVGVDGTEVYLAKNKVELAKHIIETCGKEFAKEELSHIHRIPRSEWKIIMEWDEDGKETFTTWEAIVDQNKRKAPIQVSTGYN